MCSFCVVPFTRGRERSRDVASIIHECQNLFDQGYREVNLLGQNVDSYRWINPTTREVITFDKLIQLTAQINPDLRIRFSTSHPKDITDEVLHIMAKYPNICKYIHLPVQSGNTRILQLMNRTYTKEWYLNKVKRIKEIMPDCAISSDIIVGFCTETEEDHQDTLDVMRQSKYEYAYMFAYSERPGTLAAKRYQDDVSEADKKKRLDEIIALQAQLSLESNLQDVGKTFEVLVEGDSKKSNKDWCGRNSQNKMIVFPKTDAPITKGMYVQVAVTKASQATLMGNLVNS
jgi:tRNA-2-methylthio-N6-dimethylallyladenosine synthase